MKKLIAILIVSLLASQFIKAQGVIYISNLDQPASGSLAVDSSSLVASAIVTGTNAGGYTLDSVQLGMMGASNSPSGFTAMVFNVSPLAIVPGYSLATLYGSADPSAAGTYTYTPASSLTLLPSTWYFIVLTAGTTLTTDAYEWNFTASSAYNAIGGWEAGGIFEWSIGSHWSVNPGSPQFAVTATSIPEPGVLILFALGGLGFLWQRRKAKAF